jgi:hypothetical protein
MATRDCHATALYKDTSNCLLTGGVPGGYVEEFLRGLRLLTAKLIHQGSANCAGPKRRYIVGVTYLGEFMALLRRMPDIVP